MFAVIQFPFAELRPFLPTEPNMLSVPPWPIPIPDKHFIRSFGVVKKRRRGGIDSWPAEGVFCASSNAIRFEKRHLGTLIARPEDCVCRRILYDGGAVARLEVGFSNHSDHLVDRLNSEKCLGIVNEVLSTPVRIKQPGGKWEAVDLAQVDGQVAALYLRATTKHIAGFYPAKWWLSPGEPLLLIEAPERAIDELPKFSRRVRIWEPGLSLAYCRVAYKGRALGVWFLLKGWAHEKDLIRRVRLHLFRLHAEQECLKGVLRGIAEGQLQVVPGSAGSELLQQYLDDAVSMLTKKTCYGIPQTGILRAAEQVEEMVAEGDRETLLVRLESIRKTLLRRVSEYTRPPGAKKKRQIHVLGAGNTVVYAEEVRVERGAMTQYKVQFGDHANFAGDFVVANTIQNSFNKVVQSDTSAALRNELEDLHKSVLEMSKHLDSEKSRQAARDLETLTAEATSAAPRPEWYHLSAKGLLEAANFVGEIAAPVVKGVKAVIGLLLGTGS